MKEFKFRYRGADGAPYFKTLTLPDDAAQFCGTDKHGKGIYEGDIIQYDYNGVHYEYKARLTPCAVADNGCYLYAKQFAERELKEADQWDTP